MYTSLPYSISVRIHIHLKRISNWPLYKIWYYATYLIDASKVWLLCIVHAIISINGKKKTFPCTKLSMRNGECEHRSCVRATRARQRSCRIWKKSIPRWLSIMKNIRYGKNKHNRTRSSLFIQRKTPSVNITAMRYQNDVIRLLLLLHIHENLGMMLARGYASCHAARSL